MTVDLRWYEGDRSQLRWLFELAEDSSTQLDSYLDLGRVLVATVDDDRVVGEAQLVPSDQEGARELKSLAVDPAEQMQGIGRALVEAVCDSAAAEGARTLLVSTASADIGNLRFYQRLRFRMLSVDRDAFTAQTGYPDAIDIDGIPLRDRVWLSRDL